MKLVDNDEQPPPLLSEVLDYCSIFLDQIDIVFILFLLSIVFLLIISGLISGSEVALFKLSSNTIDEFIQKGNKKEHAIVKVLSKPKKLLATLLILNNFINVSIVILSTSLLIYIFGEQSAKEGLLLTILTFVNTFLIVMIGEFFPKEFAYHNPVRFSKLTIHSIAFCMVILNPIAIVLMKFTNLVEKRLRKKHQSPVSEEQLEHAVKISIDENTPQNQRAILKGIVSLSSIPARHIMRNRIDISAIEYHTKFNALITKIKEFGYSRIPIYKETLDKIEGILYAKDLLNHLNEENNFKWQTLIKPVYFTPENRKIDDLLKTFQEKHVHIAIIFDEYGGVSGLITLEDILEEIIGEIHDEFDIDEVPSYKKISDGHYVFEAKTPLLDFCKIINYPIEIFEEEQGDSESIAGLLLEINKTIPPKNTVIQFKNIKFTILNLDINHCVIKSVSVEIQ